MTCSSCSRQILTLFIKDVLQVPLPRNFASGRTRPIPLNVHRRMSTTPTRRHRASSTRQNALPNVSGQIPVDDSYIPFDSETLSRAPGQSLIHPFTSRPPPAPTASKVEAEDSDFESNYSEPDIEIGDRIVTSEHKKYGDISLLPSNRNDSSRPNNSKYGIDPDKLVKQIDIDTETDMTLQRGSNKTISAKKLKRKLRRASEAAAAAPFVSETVNTARSTSNQPARPMPLPSNANKLPSRIKRQGLLKKAPTSRHASAAVSPYQSPAKSKLTSSSVVAQPRERWQIDKEALQNKFGTEGWNPRKKLSPDALEGIRALNAQYPDHFTTPILAEHFQVSPEVIRRILKSKWKPSEDEEVDRRARWDRRGEKIWTELVEKGIHAPKKWRDMGIGKGPRVIHNAPRRTQSEKQDLDQYLQAAKIRGSSWLNSLAKRIG